MDNKKKEFEDSQNNPCWVAFIHPMTFVVPDDENPWEVKLEDINNISYSSGNLVRIVAKFEIEKSELSGLICYDGAIAIPKIVKFQTKESALNYFSLFFAKLLLANFYVEGIDHKDIVNGSLNENWSIWPTELGSSSISNLHSKIRMRNASNIDTIHLANPRIIYVNELLDKLKLGEEIFKQIPNLNPKFLLRGITEFKYKNWDLVLSNLWISVEQLIDFIWNYKFLIDNEHHPSIEVPNRKRSLKEDTRTWSASVKQELLFQKNLIDEDILNRLSKARKIRNKLVHQGINIDEQSAKDILEVTIKLIKITASKSDLKSLDFSKRNTHKRKEQYYQPNFQAWKDLPDSNFIENVFGTDITRNIKK